MPKGSTHPPSDFVGRDDVLQRFGARLGHFRFFIYEGQPGIGKTALLQQMAQRAQSNGLEKTIYLIAWPGETIASILARVESRLGGRSRTHVETQGDPYGRLIDLLDQHKCVLVIDSGHHLRHEDLIALIRSAQARQGSYLFLTAARGDTQLSAMDRSAIYFERIGPLSPADALALAEKLGLREDARERFERDVQRKGAVCQPLTLRFAMSLFEGGLPDDSLLHRLSARSVQSFRVLLEHARDLGKLSDEQIALFRALATVGLPIRRDVAAKALGTGINRLVEAGLLDQIGDDVHLHYLCGQYFSSENPLDEKPAEAVSKHLQDRGVSLSEPMCVLRAAELLARSVSGEAAIDTLTHGWETARDYGFFEAYLKSVASIPRGQDDTIDTRLKLLSARARMRQGVISPALQTELETLAKHRDTWSRARALAALTFVYSQARDSDAVLKAYDQLKKVKADDENLLMESGVLAAEAMVKVGQVSKAEKLAKDLLQYLKNKKLPGREGQMHRLLARTYAEAGNLKEAVKEAKSAARAFEKAGDLYHAAAAHGYIGDLYRESGDFELAREAFATFREQALEWGDRDLLQIAELSDAWVSLDTGDLSAASKRIEAVVKEISAAASRRLKRYLAAARALLDAGRGQHAAAASALTRVIEQWEAAGQVTIADVLRAQLVRSLIACGELEEANRIVDKALARLDAETHAPRVATFLRERALISLRRKDMKTGMDELAKARKLFAQGGNRREEALTLFRIAHAALDDNDLGVATKAAKELSTLAGRIQHTRAIALARELEGRIALLNNDGKEAVAKLKEALQALKKLGDEAGTLHVSEALMRAMLVTGDYTSALKLGPKVRDQAEAMEIRDVRVRIIVMTGVALLQKGEMENVHRYFRELPEKVVSPRTAALMWRYGEALASVQGDNALVQKRRENWVRQVRRLNANEQELTVQTLEQLVLPPRERCRLRSADGESLLGTERVAWLRPEQYEFFGDFAHGRFFHCGDQLAIKAADQVRVLRRLLEAAPRVVTFEQVHETAFGKPLTGKSEKRLKNLVGELVKHLKPAAKLKFQETATGLKIQLPKNHAILTSTAADVGDLSEHQEKILELLQRFSLVPVQRVEETCALNRNEARKELNTLIKHGLVESVRAGRGQAFRLA